LLLGAVVVFGCTPTAEAPPDDATTSEGMVVWITDGDTIQVVVSDQEVEVRLAGINAPEREECFYGPALDHLIDTLRDKAVTMEIVGDDQFGRTLAHVFEGERYVNEEMVTSGLAIATTDDGDPRSPALLAAEERAAANGVGLWEPEACGPVDESRSVEIDGSVSVTDPPGPDEETLGEEWVVVANRGGAVVDLEGWTLRDESSRHRYTFPAGAMLDPGRALQVRSDDPGWAPGGEPVWNKDGDMALLRDQHGNVVSRWRY
jgi:endonuclease YncB( thermonuclease family)